jgi:hypothetical protein
MERVEGSREMIVVGVIPAGAESGGRGADGFESLSEIKKDIDESLLLPC